MNCVYMEEYTLHRYCCQSQFFGRMKNWKSCHLGMLLVSGIWRVEKKDDMAAFDGPKHMVTSLSVICFSDVLQTIREPVSGKSFDVGAQFIQLGWKAFTLVLQLDTV